jgi:hypothetical protein
MKGDHGSIALLMPKMESSIILQLHLEHLPKKVLIFALRTLFSNSVFFSRK